MSKSIWFDAEVHKACWKSYRSAAGEHGVTFARSTGAVALVFWRLSWMN